jgi:hypothetical protein
MTISAIVVTGSVVVLTAAVAVVKIPASTFACRGTLREPLRAPFCGLRWASRVVQWVLADEAVLGRVQPRLASVASCLSTSATSQDATTTVALAADNHLSFA